jgi:hypothetical protein
MKHGEQFRFKCQTMVNRLTIRISSSNMMPNLNLHSHGEHGWDLIMKRMEEWGLHHQNFMDRMELGPEPGGLVQQKNNRNEKHIMAEITQLPSGKLT